MPRLSFIAHLGNLSPGWMETCPGGHLGPARAELRLDLGAPGFVVPACWALGQRCGVSEGVLENTGDGEGVRLETKQTDTGWQHGHTRGQGHGVEARRTQRKQACHTPHGVTGTHRRRSDMQRAGRHPSRASSPLRKGADGRCRAWSRSEKLLEPSLPQGLCCLDFV